MELLANGVETRSKAVWGARVRLLAALVMAIGTASCGEAIRQGTGASYLVVLTMEGASGARPSEFGGTLLSDVITVVEDIPTTFNDLGRVTFRLAMKDPGAVGNPSVPSSANWITINRYRVVFSRTDGRNTPGVDVPYSFDGSLTLTVDTNDVTGGFTIVRNIAKSEAPLQALRVNGVVISTIAEVTFFGTDQTGRAVQAVARISVDFANFGDPSS
jgi:hypothetical protein